MKKYVFDIHLMQNIEIYLLYLFICGLIVYSLFRKHIYSIFDPLAFMMIMSTNAYAVVFYMYHCDLISNYYFFSFVFTQFFFFFGFLLNSPISKKYYSLKNDTVNKKSVVTSGYLVYLISSVLFVISQLIAYYISGIPLLMDSRLEAFTGGSGYGIIGRIIYVTSIISISFATFRLLFKKNTIFANFYDYFIVLFSIMAAILSGSKAGVLMLLFIMFITIFFGRKISTNIKIEKNFKKISIFLIFILIPVAFLTIIIQTGIEDLSLVFISLLLRFVHTGDVFFMAYPNDMFSLLDTSGNGLLELFRSPIASLRLMDREDFSLHIGLQLTRLYFDTEIITGPNARHNIFGLLHFGFIGSLIFSFILGYIFSYVRNKLYKKMKPIERNVILYTILVMSINYIGQDPSGQTIDYLFSTLLIFTPIYFLSLMLSKISKKSTVV